jgi:hypothetical protein
MRENIHDIENTHNAIGERQLCLPAFATESKHNATESKHNATERAQKSKTERLGCTTIGQKNLQIPMFGGFEYPQPGEKPKRKPKKSLETAKGCSVANQNTLSQPTPSVFAEHKCNRGNCLPETEHGTKPRQTPTSNEHEPETKLFNTCGDAVAVFVDEDETAVGKVPRILIVKQTKENMCAVIDALFSCLIGKILPVFGTHIKTFVDDLKDAVRRDPISALIVGCEQFTKIFDEIKKALARDAKGETLYTLDHGLKTLHNSIEAENRNPVYYENTPPSFKSVAVIHNLMLINAADLKRLCGIIYKIIDKVMTDGENKNRICDFVCKVFASLITIISIRAEDDRCIFFSKFIEIIKLAADHINYAANIMKNVDENFCMLVIDKVKKDLLKSLKVL